MHTRNKVYIIAEAGVNHNGSLELAYQLCLAAKNAGADAVKFQTWKTENIITKETSQAAYQTQNTGIEESQFDMLKRLELSYDSFVKLKKYCDGIGVQFLSTPDDFESLDFLCTLDMPFLKIGSGEINNIPYLRKIASKKVPVIISTGMSYMSDVRLAYNTLVESGAPKVGVLHCTTNYPCPMSEVNLNAMLRIKQELGCTVGYSDHTLGIEVPIAAVALGASIIEKHFTLDCTMDGPDHAASLNPEQLAEMIESIRNIEVALGNGEKIPNASELHISDVVLKRIVASRLIKEGETLTEDNITVKRSPNGIKASEWDAIIGQKAKKEYQLDEPIQN